MIKRLLISMVFVFVGCYLSAQTSITISGTGGHLKASRGFPNNLDVAGFLKTSPVIGGSIGVNLYKTESNFISHKLSFISFEADYFYDGKTDQETGVANINYLTYSFNPIGVEKGEKLKLLTGVELSIGVPIASKFRFVEKPHFDPNGDFTGMTEGDSKLTPSIMIGVTPYVGLAYDLSDQYSVLPMLISQVDLVH